MKFVLITYNIAINDEVMEVLEKLALKSYTRWEQVTGVGQQSGPHMDTHVWPAKNLALAVVTEDEKARLLMEGIQPALNHMLSQEYLFLLKQLAQLHYLFDSCELLHKYHILR